ncbi:helix-turn-helix transcriptional regulator [Janthinobacterium sp. SUN211]|uniref:helix-turn-helix domain-containing protein n=1 Tax=Janthinobacterium sp. SUN211 TaxID=3014786 RepID=UPI002712ED1C|nr:helix-turn-helix transcriptional regulator [Janthinobacterium sp. SUN211]MDO8052368.1 helix-turn-helix transcriptional regulator [Janthinobacterium sp. SUN211]
MSYFKDRLRAERKRLGLSQEKFAALAGVTKDTQLNYESGSRKPDSDYLIAICGAGVDSHFLLHGTPSSDELPAEESELLLGFRKLDLRGKLRLLGLVEGMAEGAAPTPAPAPAPAPQIQRKQKITIKGAVGHQVNGDVAGPLTVNVANKKTIK